jgi:D-alanyl-D-alanine endopeptidase (penicillin-binding protein 7)
LKLVSFLLACVFAGSVALPASAQGTARGKAPAKKAVQVKAAAKPAAKPAPKPAPRRAAVAAKVAVPAAAVAATAASAAEVGNVLDVKSSAALVLDAEEGTPLFAKNIDNVRAIASITKLMTAMVVLDGGQALDESIRIDNDDIDRVKGTGSRLRIGAELARRDMLHLALMSSENRAAHALGRSYPGGLAAFVEQMNRKAAELGMQRSRFVDPTGLSSENVSTADDLARLVRASVRYPLIREFSTAPSANVTFADNGRSIGFGNSNGLVHSSDWHIDVSKTGYISEAGRCLVMYARIAARPVIIVLLDSWGMYTRIGDANRIKRWMERGGAPHSAHTQGTPSHGSSPSVSRGEPTIGLVATGPGS